MGLIFTLGFFIGFCLGWIAKTWYLIQQDNKHERR